MSDGFPYAHEITMIVLVSIVLWTALAALYFWLIAGYRIQECTELRLQLKLATEREQRVNALAAAPRRPPPRCGVLRFTINLTQPKNAQVNEIALLVFVRETERIDDRWSWVQCSGIRYDCYGDMSLRESIEEAWIDKHTIVESASVEWFGQSASGSNARPAGGAA